MSDLLSVILPAILLALAIASLFYSARMFLRRQSSPGPQKSHQIAKIALGPTIIGIVIILAMGQIRPDKRTFSLLLSVPLIVFAARYAWMIFHEPTEADAIACFAHDREHCGRCGYSVTGNVTGRCPECGWIFPVGSLPIEDPDWSAWWRKWRIHYLRERGWHLSSYIGLGLYCLALAVVFWSKDNVPSAVVIALVGIHLCINAIRVIGYLLRSKATEATT